MFNNGHLERVRQTFSEQFVSDGQRILYRKNLKAAPIEVSAQERDRFIEQFGRWLRWMTGGVFVATMLVIGAGAWFCASHEIDLSPPITVATIALLLGPFVATIQWAWNAPARRLADRPRVGQALSPEEARRAALARLTWGRLGLAAAMTLVVLTRVDWRADLLGGWNLCWLALSAVLLCAIAIQAVRKLRAR